MKWHLFLRGALTSIPINIQSKKKLNPSVESDNRKSALKSYYFGVIRQSTLLPSGPGKTKHFLCIVLLATSVCLRLFKEEKERREGGVVGEGRRGEWL